MPHLHVTYFWKMALQSTSTNRDTWTKEAYWRVMDARKARRWSKKKKRWMENRCGESNQIYPTDKNPTGQGRLWHWKKEVFLFVYRLLLYCVKKPYASIDLHINNKMNSASNRHTSFVAKKGSITLYQMATFYMLLFEKFTVTKLVEKSGFTERRGPI